MANLNPEADVASALAGAVTYLDPPTGSTTLVLGTNLFMGPTREGLGDTLCVFVHCIGGAQPEPFLDGGTQSTFRALVNIVVRGNQEAYATGQALARGCLRNIHLATIPSRAYASIRAQVSEPQYDSWNETGSHVWRIAVELLWVETVAA